MKHTPGKWTIRESQTKYIIETENNHVATTQTKANANLIAAAPELLEACRVAYRVLRDSKDNSSARVLQLFARIELAIAKAEGK